MNNYAYSSHTDTPQNPPSSASLLSKILGIFNCSPIWNWNPRTIVVVLETLILIRLCNSITTWSIKLQSTWFVTHEMKASQVKVVSWRRRTVHTCHKDRKSRCSTRSNLHWPRVVAVASRGESSSTESPNQFPRLSKRHDDQFLLFPLFCAKKKKEYEWMNPSL